MKKVIFVLLILCVSVSTIKSQGENWNWFFGGNAGMNFPGGGSPVALSGGQINTSEGCSTISDGSGNLLFYTDGVTVWNKNHVVMSNGTGLKGGANSMQSSLIVKQPGSTSLYYLFTAAAAGGTAGISYSIVDMNLNSGLGDVTPTKNILLYSPACERLAGVRHCNKTDVWIITHEYNGTNNYRANLLTATGINTTAIISSIGQTITTNPGTGNTNAKSLLKGSPRGNKLACANVNFDLEIFDFDKATGILSDFGQVPASLVGTGTWYGVEFSPDGTKLYTDIRNVSKFRVVSFSLCATSNTAVASTNSVILAPTNGNLPGSINSGADGKLYVARDAGTNSQTLTIGVVTNPNSQSATYNHTGFTVGAGTKSLYGLQNTVNDLSPISPLPAFSVSSYTCLDAAFSFTNCTAINELITGYGWNFGEPSSGPANTSTLASPSHTYASAGTYTVSMTVTTACSTETVTLPVTVVCIGLPIELLSFSGSAEEKITLLNWKTASEKNNDYYAVEWSLNGIDFIEIGRTKGAGNSLVTKSYYLIHENPNLGGVNYYRLKQVDYDGSYSYSKLIDVSFKDIDDNIIVYPNPITENSLLKISGGKHLAANLKIESLNGEIIFERLLLLDSDTTLNDLNLYDLKPGVYILEVTLNDKRYILKLIR